VPASRLWEVVVERYADAETWDRTIHIGRPVPDSKPVDRMEHSGWVWETTFGQLTVQIPEARREGDGGVMAYTIAEAYLPSCATAAQPGRSTSEGPDEARLDIDVEIIIVFSPMMKMMFGRADRQMVDDLYDYLVTGMPSAAKQKASAKRQRR